MIKENLTEIFARSFRDNWEREALTDYGTPGSTITYGEFARRIARLHILFGLVGIGKGDKVAVMGKNQATWVTAFMATITYGAVIVPVLAEFSPTDATHIINHSGAKLLFVSDSICEHLEPEKMPEVMAIISLDRRRLLSEQPANNRLVEKSLRNLTRKFKSVYKSGFGPTDVVYDILPKDTLALLNYTSGTTGFSKGVMLSLNNLAGNVTFGLEQHLHFPGSRCLAFLPLAHAYGCAFDMLVPLAAGTHVTLFGRVPSPRLLLKALSEVRPNLVVVVPLILEKIYKTRIVPLITRKPMSWALAVPLLDKAIYGKIRARLTEAFGGEFTEVIVGGAPLNREVEQFLHRIHFPFTVGYGMTECGPLISYTPWREFIPGSCGRTLPGIMHSRIESDDWVTTPGEICVRGENVMLGYYRNPEATEAVLDDEGWLHTGDIGTRDPDGTLFIKGRSKTMILSSSGQNIYPEEIESKLNNMPYVSESLVVQRANGLVALVYPDYERMDSEKLTMRDLGPLMDNNLRELNTMVAPYERVSAIELVPNEFQKTPKRSIRRFLYK